MPSLPAARVAEVVEKAGAWVAAASEAVESVAALKEAEATRGNPR